MLQNLRGLFIVSSQLKSLRFYHVIAIHLWRHESWKKIINWLWYNVDKNVIMAIDRKATDSLELWTLKHDKLNAINRR